MASNFRLNYHHVWTLANVTKYCEDEEVIINGDSYDADEKSLTFACQLKEQAPDAVWDGVLTAENGYQYFQMDAKGDLYPLDPEDL